jgi:16S rRNA (cytosine1402-N4)-methyltransferase
MMTGCEPRRPAKLALGLTRHVPVLLPAVLDSLQPKDGGRYIDATFGAGGYARAILAASRCDVRAIDRDPAAIAAGAALTAEFSPRLRLEHKRFGDLLREASAEAGRYDGIVFDLGVSSMQLDTPERGFSFQSDGPLDMRMSATAGRSAADIVNSAPEDMLADILYRLGEERRARAIAAAIVRRRREQPITRTLELAEIVARVLGGRTAKGRHPATRAFQALRLYVNDELGELARGLAAAEILLKPGGRLLAVSFHSLEDRMVKRFLAERAQGAAPRSRHLPPAARTRAPSFRIVNHKPLTPDAEEIATNPRARSAKLRVGERTEAAAWPFDPTALGASPIAPP